MSWLRIGDTASMHPVVLRALELPNELFVITMQ